MVSLTTSITPDYPFISFSAWYNLRFSPMITQSFGARNTKFALSDWDLRSGTFYAELRTSEPNNALLVDGTQIAALGSSNIPPPTNFGKTFRSCVVDPIQDLAVLREDDQAGYVSHHDSACLLLIAFTL